MQMSAVGHRSLGVFMALQTGTLDGTFANYDGLRMMKLDEAAPNLLVSKELRYAPPLADTGQDKIVQGMSTVTYNFAVMESQK